MIFEATIEELVYQFSAENNDAHPIVLLGAGASVTSGIPTAHMATIEIAKWAYARQHLRTTADRANIRRAEWERFLSEQPWFQPGTNYASLYPKAVENLLVPREFRRDVLTAILRNKSQPSSGYQALADLCQRHLVYHFLTANFDPLLEEALHGKRPHIRDVTTVNKTPGDFEAFSPHRKAQIVYLHGTVENYSDKNLDSETLELESDLTERIHSLVEYAPILVVGYRGYEKSIMEGLFGAALQSSGNFRRGIFWCVRGQEEPHENVYALHDKVGTNLRLVRIEGFDELFVDLNRKLKGQSLNPKDDSRSLHQIKSQPYDSEVLLDKRLSDLDEVPMRARLAEHQRRIGNSEIKDFDQFLLEYEFAERADGELRPKRGLWLLFGKNDSVTYEKPYLKSILKIGTKQQRVIEGNLVDQFEQIRSLLNEPDFNPEIRIKGESGSIEKKAYHTRAILELLVNHFVHRDYSIEEPCEIHYLPGESIVFSTVGGLPQKTAIELDHGQDGFFRPQRGIKFHRNPLLADVFFGMNYMDGEGSGLVDVEQYASEHHGQVTFQNAENRVISCLSQALQDRSGKGRTANPQAKKRIYTTNLLAIQALPEKVFRLPLLHDCSTSRTAYKKQGVDYRALPSFVVDGGMAVSFCDWQILSDEIGNWGYLEYADDRSVQHWVENVDKRRLIVSLLRKEWENYLAQFGEAGLIVDRQKSRAYFLPENEKGRTVVWNSSARKKIKRGVVKRRDLQSYENEGVSYSVQQFGEMWTIQIKPIYVFTTSDGRTPITGIEQTKRATRRYKFDRNNSVASDLSFWTAFLGKGKSHIDISRPGTESIFVACSLKEAECVAEVSA